MQNLEALYIVEFGDAANPAQVNRGVAVLETGRIFGGDTGYYYTGQFTISGASISAIVEVVKHNPTWRDAFGDTAKKFTVKITGTVADGTMTGQMERIDRPGARLPIRMTRTASLP